MKFYSTLIIFFIISVSQYPQQAQLVFEGYINGEFEGWEGETLFEMSDGTFWLQVEYSYLYQYEYNPEAIIFEKDGDYFLKVKDIDEILHITPIEKVINSRIDGDFEGFEGDTVYKLLNGTIWQQVDGKYKYRYAYSPKVVVYMVGKNWNMNVKGITVKVIQLR